MALYRHFIPYNRNQYFHIDFVHRKIQINDIFILPSSIIAKDNKNPVLKKKNEKSLSLVYQVRQADILIIKFINSSSRWQSIN
jgi:hypothetical protein